MIKKLLFLGLLICNQAHLYAVVAKGDAHAASGKTFSFSVGSGIYDPVNQRLWTLSGQNLSVFDEDVQSYGISYTNMVNTDGHLNEPLIAYPYLTTQAYITTMQGGDFHITSVPQANPLLGKKFSAVSFVGTNLTVVETSTPQFVYFIQRTSFDDNQLGKSSPDGTSIINMLDLGEAYEAVALGTSLGGSLFIGNSQGTFGTDTSYISFATTKNNAGLFDDTVLSFTTLIKQADKEIDKSTQVLTAGTGDLDSMNAQVVMYQSPLYNSQMYIGLDVTAGNGLYDRAVALFIATAKAATDDTSADVIFSSVLPDAVTIQDVQTPISATRTLRVAVSNVTTTATSTGLSYFITSRFNNAGQQFIYAMPMVTMSADTENNGKIADFDSIAQTFQIKGITYRVQGFDRVIEDAEQINIASSTPAVLSRLCVGGGAVPLASGQLIEQLVAQGDAVYITIHNAFDTDSTPGMFKSQALFDAQGRIKSWTAWQRVAGTDDQMIFAIKDRVTDATMYVSGADSNTIQQTTWNSTTDLTTFVDTIQSVFPAQHGGVQNIITISPTTPDLTGFPLAVATGNGAAVIAQTGSLNAYDQIAMDNPQHVITINSDLGLAIGSVVAVTFAHDTLTSNNWLFLGGDSGLAVLSNDTTGIGFQNQLTSLDDLIATGKSCKTLGDFKFVKKLVCSGNALYVLTTTGVYKITLNANKFKLHNPADLDTQLVIQSSTTGAFGYCLDMIIDNNLMLLGTTNGLYSVDISGGLPVTPVSIEIPGGLAAVSRLTTVAPSGVYDQDFYNESNLYVLTINFGLQQASLNRFTITAGVVQPIQDQLLEGVNGPLLNFDYMSNNIFIDGSLGFATAYRIADTPATVKYLQYTVQAGKSSTQILLKAHTTDISIHAVLYALGIAGITRDYASGCLMLAGSFGLLTDS